MKKTIIAPPNDPYIKEVTGDALVKKYQDEVGHKAVVQRSVLDNERTDQLKEVLQDIGRDALAVGFVPKGMEYMGSVAVHIYRAPTLGAVVYFNQTALNECPEQLAGPAVSDLRGAMLSFYGRKRQKKRSGF